jgi:hypothetical protein
MPINLSSDFDRTLKAGFAVRQQLRREFPAIGRHVRQAVEAAAKRHGCVAERRDKYKPGKVAWRIRPAKPGETPGEMSDV